MTLLAIQTRGRIRKIWSRCSKNYGPCVPKAQAIHQKGHKREIIRSLSPLRHISSLARLYRNSPRRTGGEPMKFRPSKRPSQRPQNHRNGLWCNESENLRIPTPKNWNPKSLTKSTAQGFEQVYLPARRSFAPVEFEDQTRNQKEKQQVQR